MTDAQAAADSFLKDLESRNPHQPEFIQAAGDVVRSVMPWYVEQDDYRRTRVLERLTEPDRCISFRVAWEDDAGEVRINRGWRVQFNHALGPYKGGLRFSPAVNESVLKFLGLEQTLKNSLTGLPMGGAKGGADFDPKNASITEIRRFCQALMDELHRHIGPETDVPAGDIGVGPDEISVLFGRYLKLSNSWHGALTGKDDNFGGSAIRAEATGYGCVYFCENMLARHDRELAGRRVAISGSGNVALYAAEKALQREAIVVSLSDSDGCARFEDGLDREQLEDIRELKRGGKGRLAEYASESKGVRFEEDAKPWEGDCDIAMPCATQNELDEDDARRLIENGAMAVCEGANMPVTGSATELLRENGVPHGPGKAANAGGVAVSGLEQSQNAMRLSWSREDVDGRLREIMRDIHEACVRDGGNGKRVDYVDGANLAGFKRVAEAMHSFWTF